MLVSLEALKDFNSITVVDDDHLLYESLQAGYKRLEEMLDYTLESEILTEYYKGHGDNELIVNKFPVTVAKDIWDDSTFVFADATKIDPDDILLLPPDSTYGIIRLITGKFTASESLPNIKITYTTGYTAVTFPRDLKNATLMLASLAYRQAKGGVNSVEGDQEDITVTWFKNAKEIANRYRKVR